MRLYRRLYRPAQVAELDRLAIETHGIPGYDLMNRAGQRVFETLRARWPEARAITICCGAGNNGGDGYVVARLALEAGLGTQLIALKPIEELHGDARRAARDWRDCGGGFESADERLRGDVVVDALLGTGLDRPAAGEYARLIDLINSSGRPVVAVDVPSGLSADTGMPPGVCVRADTTVSFIGAKRGLFTGQAGRWCGDPVFDDLDTPAEIHESVEADAQLLDVVDLRHWLPPRPADTHKGDLGHVLVLGGAAGMAGAPVLAGRAALHAGSGLVSLATLEAHALAAMGAAPELMAFGCEDSKRLEARIGLADVLALGPGLGRGEWSSALFDRALAEDKPLVVDADGLNLLSEAPRHRERWVLTPHPGEAAKLLGSTVPEIQADRFSAARELARRFNAVVVLKGHGSLIAAPDDRLSVCPYGNPAMASAGMGDALTGLVASFLGQGMGEFEAACCAVLAHALAGDRAARGRRQILASDLIGAIESVLPA